MPKTAYAWCFSHGLLHAFPADADPWCTGHWVSLSNQSEEAALKKKAAYYGGAAFLEDLPYETKLEVLEIGDTRD